MTFFVLSILSYLMQNFSNKQFTNIVHDNSINVLVFQNGLCVLSASIMLFCVSDITVLPAFLMLLAAVFGAIYLTTVFLLLKAFSYGPMGNSTLLCNVGMFISAFYGILRFDDNFSVFIALGAILLFLAVILCTPKGNNQKKGGYLWFLIAVLSGLSNGVVASVKREAVAINPNGVQNFLFWGFLFAALFAFLILLLFRKNRRSVMPIFKQPRLWLCGIFAGVGTAGGNCFQMMALKSVSSAIIYPLTSGVLVVSLWCASCFLYKETPLKKRNILAVICCVLAIVLVNIK